jgi:tripartite-type tricarboxylate transporter receptor subunit TctC
MQLPQLAERPISSGSCWQTLPGSRSHRCITEAERRRWVISSDGHVSASVNPVSEILEFAKSGEIRTMAVTGSRRSLFLPDIPTMREAGYSVIVDSWTGTFLPAQTPERVVNTLADAIGQALNSAQVIENLAKTGNAPAFQSPAQFAAMVKADLLRWGLVVKASGFIADD